MDDSLREARQMVAVHADLIANGEARELQIEAEIEQLEGKLHFLRTARASAPEALARAQTQVRTLEHSERCRTADGRRESRTESRAAALTRKLQEVIGHLKAAQMSDEEIRECLTASGLSDAG